MLQLKYRYDREVDRCERYSYFSCIRPCPLGLGETVGCGIAARSLDQGFIATSSKQRLNLAFVSSQVKVPQTQTQHLTGIPQALENMENDWKKFLAWKNHGI